jgi:hypothetical protein
MPRCSRPIKILILKLALIRINANLKGKKPKTHKQERTKLRKLKLDLVDKSLI